MNRKIPNQILIKLIKGFLSDYFKWCDFFFFKLGQKQNRMITVQPNTNQIQLITSSASWDRTASFLSQHFSIDHCKNIREAPWSQPNQQSTSARKSVFGNGTNGFEKNDARASDFQTCIYQPQCFQLNSVCVRSFSYQKIKNVSGPQQILSPENQYQQYLFHSVLHTKSTQ